MVTEQSIGTFLRRAAGTLFPRYWKHRQELAYWKSRQREERILSNRHYEFFYTTHFGLGRKDWDGKVVLDVGCGPRGSLEWATAARERYGLDPLADEYVKLGGTRHGMTYVQARAEEIPFADEYFDIVSSLNSIDHVDDLAVAIAEIKRVLKRGGLFLLLTDVGHDPTPTEPLVIDFDIVDDFGPELEVVTQRHFEKVADGLYESISADVPYDHADATRRYGILSASFRKR